MSLPEGISDLLPLSPAQQGMLFHIVEGHQTHARYVAVISLRIKGVLVADRLKQAIEQTVNAHDTLRASFIYENVKTPVQAIREAVELPFETLDWSDKPDTDSLLDALILEEQSREFDLIKAPLMALKLVRLSQDTHALVWTVQHLISDGWSLAVVLDEIFARYEGKTPANAARFRDYLAWLKAQPSEASDAFWSKHLSGCSPSLLDLPAEPEPQGEGLVTAQLPAELITQADALARKLQITQNVLLSSVWSLVLRKVTGASDVIFGSTSAGRPAQIPGIGRAVGAYVNTLPVRQIIDPSATVTQFLTAAGQLHRDRAPHEFVALAHVQSFAKQPAGTALFDTLFVHQGLPPAQNSYDGFEIEPPRIRQSSNFALAMLARPGDELGLELIFDEARVAEYVAQSVMQLYCDLLKAVIAAPEARLDALLPKAAKPKTPPAFEDVVARFMAHAKATPDAVAITDHEGSISYGALLAQASSIAGALLSAGLETDDLVPVALPRGRDCVAAYLGVMLAGGAYVPIDLDYPQDRIAQVFNAIAPKQIIAAQDTDLPLNAQRVDPQQLNAVPATAPKTGALAYVIFTSGSQGVPKGVEITRHGLAYSTGVRAEVFDTTPDSFLLLSSLAFDSSVVGLYWTLASGGHLVIAPARAEQDPSALGTLIADHNVTHTLCLPGLYEALLGAVDAGQLSTLNTIIVAGEAPTAALSAQHRAALPHAKLYNEYGPTEGTVWCAAHDSTDHMAGPVPIGKAPPGSALIPCDPDGAPLPPGISGEMVLFGPGVARGYYKAKAETEQRFVGDGFMTGDLGRSLPDGEIIFLGRNDAQVKIRGHRIELGDIEAAASAFDPATTYVAVATKRTSTPRIILFAEAETVTPYLRPALSNALPAHFLPSEITAIAALPMLPNGKINRAALENLTPPQTQQADDHPKDELETILAGLWTEVLGTAPIARGDNFFDIGGDSLKSIALFARAEKLGLRMRPTDIFDHQTLAELAQHLAERDADPSNYTQMEPYNTANEDGTRAPVFLLHANMNVYRNLVNGLGKHHPVALQFSHHFKGVEVPAHTSIPELATDAFNRLRALRPHGPYVICGYSAGAYVAIELATMLRNTGEEVALLSLIDPPFELAARNPFAPERLREKAKTVFYALGKHLGVNKDARHAAQVTALYAKAVDAYALPAYDGYCHIQLTPGNAAMEPGSTLSRKLSNVAVNHLNCTHDELLTSPAYALAVASRIIEEFRKR